MELNKIELYLNHDFDVRKISSKISVFKYKTWVFWYKIVIFEFKKYV